MSLGGPAVVRHPPTLLLGVGADPNTGGRFLWWALRVRSWRGSFELGLRRRDGPVGSWAILSPLLITVEPFAPPHHHNQHIRTRSDSSTESYRALGTDRPVPREDKLTSERHSAQRLQ
jgi:hypothetical protein